MSRLCFQFRSVMSDANMSDVVGHLPRLLSRTWRLKSRDLILIQSSVILHFSVDFSLACKRILQSEIVTMLHLLIVALLFSSASAQSSCSELYASHYLSKNFNETIAHTIHSMNVQGLRLFNPRATEDNHVPTVNHNIQDEASTFYSVICSNKSADLNNGIFTYLNYFNSSRCKQLLTKELA